MGIATSPLSETLFVRRLASLAPSDIRESIPSTVGIGCGGSLRFSRSGTRGTGSISRFKSLGSSVSEVNAPGMLAALPPAAVASGELADPDPMKKAATNRAKAWSATPNGIAFVFWRRPISLLVAARMVIYYRVYCGGSKSVGAMKSSLFTTDNSQIVPRTVSVK